MRLTRRNFIKYSSILPALSLPKPVFDIPTFPRICILADLQNAPEVPAVFDSLVQRAGLYDLVLGAGDIVDIIFPGHDDEQWTWTLAQFARLGDVPIYLTPGNHDLCRINPDGTGAGEDGPQEATATAAWVRNTQSIGNAGALRFSVATERTRFVGFNFLDWSIENQTWLDEQLTMDSRRVVVINHLPLGGEINPAWYGSNYQAKMSFFRNRAKPPFLYIGAHHHHFKPYGLDDEFGFVAPPFAPVAFGDRVEPIPNGLLPLAMPMRGWVELVDSDTMYLQLYRVDGVMIWEKPLENYQTFFPMITR